MSIVNNPAGVGRGALLRRNPNIVHRLLYDPCQLDFWVYIETLVPAFAILWFTASVPLLDDILRDNAYRKLAERRGGSLRTLRHGQIGMRGGREPSVNRWTDRGLRTLLKLTEPLEKIGFVVLLFYAVDRFYFNWSSLLDNRLCTPEARGSGFKATDGDGLDPPNEEGGSIGMTQSQEAWGSASVSSFGGSLPNGHYFISLAVNYLGDSPNSPTEYKLRLRVPGNLGRGIFDGPSFTVGGGRNGSGMVTADVNLPLFTGSSVTWEIVGPAVPTGLHHSSAICIAHQTS